MCIRDSFNGVDEFFEHVEAFFCILLNRIMLRIRAQIDTTFEFLHIVNVIHPFGIDHFEQDDTLQLTHDSWGEFCLSLCIEFGSFLLQILFNVVFVRICELFAAFILSLIHI